MSFEQVSHNRFLNYLNIFLANDQLTIRNGLYTRAPQYLYSQDSHRNLVMLVRIIHALGEQGGNGVQGFFSAAGNDNSALDLRTVQRTADEGGQGGSN